MDPADTEHKLAAVLSADVVGYSRLMAEDENATVQTVTAYREQVEELVRRHHGRLVDFTGDNFLAEFASTLHATTCAIEIQSVLRSRNAELPRERRMEFKMGVHLGELRIEGERIYGTGVNIAARLHALAEPGGVCVSGIVHDELRNKLDLDYVDLGERSVKNIPDPIRVYRVSIDGERASPLREPRLVRAAMLAAVVLLVGGVAVAGWRTLGPDLSARAAAAISFDRMPGAEELTVRGFAGRPAIAVLAFDNLSGDPEQEYFADAIVDELITRLQAWRWYPVIARNSSFVYRGKATDVKQISAELGVRYVVEGSVRKVEDRVRVNAQLIDATTGHHVWAELYDRELRDLFAVQDEITEAIVTSINPEIRQHETRRALRADPEDLDAWESAHRAQWHSRKETREDNLVARALYERAVELDPQFVWPLFGIEMTHWFDMQNQWTDSPQRSVAEMVRMGKSAVALDPGDPIAQVARTLAYMVEGEGEKAIASAKLAIELDPSSVLGHLCAGLHLATMGRPDEGIPYLEDALRLNPTAPSRWALQLDLALAHFVAGHYEEAVHWNRRGLELRPDLARGYVGLAASYAQLGELDEARAALAKALELDPEFSLDRLQWTFLSPVDPDFVERVVDGLRKAGLPG